MAIQGLEFDKPTLVDGGHEQKAIVNTASGKQHVNAPTVEDIKRIAKGEAEKEAEAASATEWEKSIKEHISYDGDDVELDVNADINANGYNIYGVEDTTTNSISCNTLYSNNDGDEVLASNLIDGGRVFKHDLVISLKNEGESSARFLYVSAFSSNPREIDGMQTLDEDYPHQLLDDLLAKLEDADLHLVMINYVNYNSGEIGYTITDGTTIYDQKIVAIEDTVTQC